MDSTLDIISEQAQKAAEKSNTDFFERIGVRTKGTCDSTTCESFGLLETELIATRKERNWYENELRLVRDVRNNLEDRIDDLESCVIRSYYAAVNVLDELDDEALQCGLTDREERIRTEAVIVRQTLEKFMNEEMLHE